ncbi:MAG TPA: TIGR03089 family protein [Nocardioidaceae bacterium]|nr:TIGR03089 family protein [Nocardioidaceae bacterium]
MSPSPTHHSFPDLLSATLRSAPARPLVTFYDDATGERVELSVTTYANWVAKTAGLVQDELDVEHGSLVLVDLPTHWLGAVWLGALWSGGQVVTTDPLLSGEADLVVCGPDGVGTYADRADVVPVVALSLRPLGARFAEPLPTGVVDYGAVVLGQPDVFMALHPAGADDGAWREGDTSLTQADLLADAAATPLVEPGGRLLTDVNPCTARGRGTLLSPLLLDGSTVWVRNPDERAWERRYDEERATARLRAALPS